MLLYGWKSIVLLLIATSLRGCLLFGNNIEEQVQKEDLQERMSVVLMAKRNLRDEFFVLWKHKFAACAAHVSCLIALHLVAEGVLGA